MNRQSWMVLSVVLALVGGTAAFLAHARSNQKLGDPGVKVGPVPMFCQENDATGTNRLFLISPTSVLLPEKVLDFDSIALPVSQVVYDWLPKDTLYGQRVYVAPDGFQMLNNVVLMGGDRTSIHQPQYCLTGQGMQIKSTEKTSIRIERPHPYDLEVMKLVATGNSRTKDGRSRAVKAVYVYWFVADGELTADHSERMWWMARDLIQTGVLQRWAYIAYLAYCLPGQEDATYERMKRAIAAAVPEFQSAVGPPTTDSASNK